jgi:replication factor C large subunit
MAEKTSQSTLFGGLAGKQTSAGEKTSEQTDRPEDRPTDMQTGMVKEQKPSRQPSKPWILSYSPKNSKEVLGQDKAIADLLKFIIEHKTQKKKAALLWGPTGCGKTSMVQALAKEHQLEIIELNASDFRTGDDISRIMGAASQQKSLFSRGKILLIDEIDGISGREDRGGVPELAKITENTRFPVVMTANDPFDKKFTPLRKNSLVIECETPTTDAMQRVLKRIAIAENITHEDETLTALARRSGGDMRAAINDLQIIATINGKVTRHDLDELSSREKKETIINAILKIFKTTDIALAVTAFDHVDEDLEECALWLEENLPYEYEKPKELSAAYDWLAKASVMNARIRRWQHWRFLVYVNAYMSGGVAASKEEKYKKSTQYKQSMRPLKIWQANMKNQRRKAISEKIAMHTHTSLKRAFSDTYPYLKVIVKNNPKAATAIAEQLDLEPEDIRHLKE